MRLRLPEPGHQPLPHVKDYPQKKRNKNMLSVKSQKKIELGIQPRRPRRYSSKKPQPVDVDVSLGLLLFTPKLTDNETRLTHFPPADDRSTCPSNSSVRYKHSVQCSRLYSFGPPHLSLSAFYTQICNSSHDRTDPTGFTSSGIIYYHPLLVA